MIELLEKPMAVDALVKPVTAKDGPALTDQSESAAQIQMHSCLSLSKSIDVTTR
jgi:hypothetical protein